MLTEHLYRCEDFSRLLRLFRSLSSRVIFWPFPVWNTCARARRRQRLECRCRKSSCDPDQDEPTAGGSIAGSCVDWERRNLPMYGFILGFFAQIGLELSNFSKSGRCAGTPGVVLSIQDRNREKLQPFPANTFGNKTIDWRQKRSSSSKRNPLRPEVWGQNSENQTGSFSKSCPITDENI